jgi:hypothetical protein
MVSKKSIGCNQNTKSISRFFDEKSVATLLIKRAKKIARETCSNQILVSI